MLTELKNLGAEDGGHWESARRVLNSLAADFGSSAGAVWNVVGVATHILREYVVSKDHKMMEYTVTINNSVITLGAAPQWLSVALPPGWALRDDIQSTGIIYCATGFAQNGAFTIFEPIVCFLNDTGTAASRLVVLLYRNLLTAWPDDEPLSVRFTILIPVEKVNYQPAGYGDYPIER
jgi:hypothetical protein